MQEMSATQDAILDISAYGLAELPDLLAYVTVRHPASELYMPASAALTGYAAQRGEHDKAVRYPPCGGRTVVALAHESFGRLGTQAEEMLALCTAIATRRAHRLGVPPRRVVRDWRARLDATLARGLAAQLHQAHQGTPGQPAVRRRRLSNTDAEARCPLGDAAPPPLPQQLAEALQCAVEPCSPLPAERLEHAGASAPLAQQGTAA